MNRFCPSIETLDDRALPSAVFANPDSALLPVTQAVQVGADSNSVIKPAATASGALQIELENVLVSSYQRTTEPAPAGSQVAQPAEVANDPAPGDVQATEKVTFQDFHFTAKVSKSSPGLFH